MFEIITHPGTWFVAAAVIGSCTFGVLVALMVECLLRQSGYVEPEPKIDMDLFDAEMAMEGARIEEQLASQRRAEMIARAS